MRFFSLVIVLLLGATRPAVGQISLEAVRIVTTDLDRDGQPEVITVGRVGGYRQGAGGRGGLQVSQPAGGRLRTLGYRDDTPILRDVAIGDFASDLTLDVFSIGEGWLWVHAYAYGDVTLVDAKRLDTDWTDRVAVLGDGVRTLVVATEYAIRPDRDVGMTRVRGFDCGPGSFEEIWTFDLSAHVGDLALLDADGPYLVLETGTGDEGGDVLVYDVSGSPTRVWEGRTTSGRRCLVVEALAEGRVLLRSADGDAVVFTLSGGVFRRERTLGAIEGDLVLHVLTNGHPGGVGTILPGKRWAIRPLTF